MVLASSICAHFRKFNMAGNKESKSLEFAIANSITEYKGRVALLSLIILLFFCAGASRLGFDTNYKIFVEPENAYRQSLEAMEETYASNEDTVVFIVHALDGDVLSIADLSALGELVDGVKRLPFVVEVEAITNTQRFYVTGDDIFAEDLVPVGVELDEARIQIILDEVSRTPGLLGHYVSTTYDAAVVIANFSLLGNRTAGVQEVAEASRDLSQEFLAENPDLNLYIGGLLMFDQAMVDVIRLDARTLIPWAALFVFALLVFVFRSIALPSLIVFALLLSVLATFGLAGWWNYNVNVLTFSAILIISTLSVADSVHLISNYLSALREDVNVDKAMLESLTINLQPMFLTSLTTSIGFLGLGFSSSPPVQELGVFTAVGVFMALFVTIGIVPFIATVLPGNRRALPPQHDVFWSRFALFLTRRRVVLVVSISFAAILFSLPIGRNELNDDSFKWFSEEIEFRRATDFAAGRLTGLRNISYSLDSGEADGVTKLAYIQQVQLFSDWLSRQDEVVQVRSYLDVLKDLNFKLHESDPEFLQLPRTRSAAAEYLLLYELSVPSWRGLQGLLSIDKREARIVVNLSNLNNREYLEFEQRASNWLSDNALDPKNVGASVPLMFAHISQENLFGMIVGSSAALVLITLTITIAFRSLKYGLISLIPNGAPILMVYGAWGILDGQLNLAAVTMFSISLGIVVDDTIHLLSKYVRALRSGETVDESIAYAIRTAAPALCFTTVSLGIGFFLLGFSSFELSATQGVMVGSTILLALALDLFYLPVLLSSLENGVKGEGK